MTSTDRDSVAIRIRPYETGAEAAIVETFHRVFREVCGEGFRERGLDEWRWAFE